MFINSPCIAQENSPLTVEETNVVIKDSVSTDTTQVKKSFFNSGAVYKASDTVSINPNQKKITLFNNAKLVYGDMEITSGKIVIDYIDITGQFLDYEMNSSSAAVSNYTRLGCVADHLIMYNSSIDVIFGNYSEI